VETTPGDVLTAEAAGGFFDTMVRFLRTSMRALAVAGLLAGLAFFVAGPSAAAVKTRATFRHGLGSAREGAESAGWDTGRLGTWVFARRRTLQIVSLVIGGLALMFWTRPTAWVVLGVALVVVVLLALIEFLGTPPVSAVGAEDPAPAPSLPSLPSQPMAGPLEQSGPPRPPVEPEQSLVTDKSVD
jgi:hypothetical protein